LLSRASLNLRVVALKIRGGLCEHAFPSIKHKRVFDSNDGRFPCDYCKGLPSGGGAFAYKEENLEVFLLRLGNVSGCYVGS